MTKKNECPGHKVMRTASLVLRNSGASKTSKSLAGSALAPARTTKSSTATTVRTAAKALNDGRTNASTKTLAGSVLTQHPGERK